RGFRLVVTFLRHVLKTETAMQFGTQRIDQQTRLEDLDRTHMFFEHEAKRVRGRKPDEGLRRQYRQQAEQFIDDPALSIPP
ncbi:MAG: hypothetical protein P8Y54_13485, partial [Xanthomonadales bacterium]